MVGFSAPSGKKDSQTVPSEDFEIFYFLICFPLVFLGKLKEDAMGRGKRKLPKTLKIVDSYLDPD